MEQTYVLTKVTVSNVSLPVETAEDTIAITVTSLTVKQRRLILTLAQMKKMTLITKTCLNEHLVKFSLCIQFLLTFFTRFHFYLQIVKEYNLKLKHIGITKNNAEFQSMELAFN